MSEKKENVWNRLKDDLKSVLEKSTDNLEQIAVRELKEKECYTDVTYGTFNTLKACNVKKLGNKWDNSMFFQDFLKKE